jgi:pimeloyl-ACP methyl ester carboxylesterase
MDDPRQPRTAPPLAVPRRRPGLGWWLVRVALAVLLGLLVALLVDVVRSGGPQGWLSRHGIGVVGILGYRAEGELVEVDGRRLYLDCRGSGSPTIVLQAGLGTGAETWAAVLGDLVSTTRTCAYDRPGIGRSDPGSTPDHAAAAADLAGALAAAGEEGPFVLVGHSLGADMVRVHASLYRDDVVGVVLVDGFEPDLFETNVAPLLGSLAEEYLDRQDGLWDLIRRSEGLDPGRSTEQLRAADLRGLPIQAVVAARGEPRLDETTNAAIRAAAESGYDALSPGMTRLTLAYSSGHLVQFDRPELVVEAVRRVVEAARSEG